MILQKIVWDDSGEFGCREMFFRGGASVEADSALKLTAGESVSFDTYFNLFSVWKWREYTVVRNLFVCVELRGSGRIFLIGLDRDNPQREQIICSLDYDCDEFREIVVNRGASFEEYRDFCFLRVEASAETMLRGGSFAAAGEGPVGKREDIRLACCICTYKREEFVKRNVDTLLREIIDSPDSVLHGRLEISIADNGRTLSAESFGGHPSVHIYPNPNFGGSAGFARNIIETAIYREKDGFSHLILMDDDILIYPRVLERSYAYLSVLKEEYRNCILGGAMLLLEKKNIQAEGCGRYNLLTGGNQHTRKMMLDLTARENLVYNECDEDANFSGWWYSCIPVSIINAANLPLPLFLHRDDQEYGIRAERKILQLGGICIWHPSPAGKHSDYIMYYDIRNMLIADMNHYPEKISAGALKKTLAAKVIQCCLGYRYGSALMALRGCEDFCRGIVYFKGLNPENLHQELLEQGGQEWFEISANALANEAKKLEDERKLHPAVKLWRYIFPFRRICYVEAACNYPSYLGYKKVVYLNETKELGHQLVHSLPMTFCVFKELIRVCRLIDRDYEKACGEWEKGIDELKSLEFWEKYLGLG